MLAKFLRNTSTAIRHPGLGLEYLRWRLSHVLGHPLLVSGAFGTRLQTSTFANLRSTRAFVPKGAEALMIRRLSSKHPVFMDIGANVGVWSVALAAAHPTARVYCFEPTPDTFGLLVENVRLNGVGNITALQMALSDTTGVLLLQTNQRASIYNRLMPSSPGAIDLGRGRFTNARSVEVESVKLDEFCERNHIQRIGFLKIDVEGAEVRVLRGAERLLREQAIETLWMEVDAENLQEMGDSVESLAAMMQRFGYTFHCLEEDGSSGPSVDARSRVSLNLLLRPVITASTMRV